MTLSVPRPRSCPLTYGMAVEAVAKSPVAQAVAAVGDPRHAFATAGAKMASAPVMRRRIEAKLKTA